MSQSLNVFMDGVLAGILEEQYDGKLTFTYTNDYAADPSHTPLAPLLPLQRETFRSHRPLENYLRGLLPDNEQVLERWAADANVSPNNAFRLLAGKGEDAPGAIQILPSNTPAPDAQSRTTNIGWLTDRELTNTVQHLRSHPTDWSTYRFAGKWSLPGSQGKIALFHDGDRWGVPLDATPTTHILKPGVAGLSFSDVNEYVSQNAARALGLPAATTTLRDLEDGTTVLVSERFDRVQCNDAWHRLHQVDLVQAAGIPPGRKYEMTLKQVSKLLAATTETLSDYNRRTFLQYLAYNYAIRGTDAHAKNYALLVKGSSYTLAPLYDTMSLYPHQDVFPAKQDVLPIPIGKVRDPRRVSTYDWEQAARMLALPSNEDHLTSVRDIVINTPDAVRDVITGLRSTHPQLFMTSDEDETPLRARLDMYLEGVTKFAQSTPIAQ